MDTFHLWHLDHTCHSIILPAIAKPSVLRMERQKNLKKTCSYEYLNIPEVNITNMMKIYEHVVEYLLYICFPEGVPYAYCLWKFIKMKPDAYEPIMGYLSIDTDMIARVPIVSIDCTLAVS